MIYRLFNHSDKVLMNHIRRHCNQKLRNTVACFLPHIDIKKLLYEARDRIEDMNANHFEFSDMYRFRLDSLIGYKGDLDTSDLCVATLIDTKDIITMYPVLLSEEFDIEGLATSEELRFFTYENVKKGMYIQVRNKGKTREIIVRQDLRREILEYCEENEINTGFIFRSPKNQKKMLHRTTIYRRLKKIAGAARVKKELIYAHAFRHYFSITYLENGGNQLNLRDILGHSSLETTNIYAKRTRKDLRKQLESMNFKGGK